MPAVELLELLEPEVVEEVEVEVVVKANPIADIYDRAASLLEQYGWVQGHFGSKDTGVCLIGAINLAYSNSAIIGRSNLYKPIVNATTTKWWDDGRSANGGAIWNDAPGRTKEEVIAKLHEIARELRCQQS